MRNSNNKRMRGRNNRGGGKGPNPLSRSYESNGPDVKIRGTAQHVAEKYLQLARDAHSSGDPVSAESYLQHAEHYFRLIAAAQEALRQQQAPRVEGQVDDEGDDDDDDDFASPFDKRFESPVQAKPEVPPPQQPRDFGGQPREYQGQRDFQGQREPRDYQGQRDFQGQREPRDYQGQRDFQGQNRGDRDRFPGGQRFPDRQDRQDRPRPQPEAVSGEQPDVAGTAPDGEGGQPRDGRPYESRRERFERRRAERFAERQARRETGGFDAESADGGDHQPHAAPAQPAPAARDEDAGLGLPSFITGGAAVVPAVAEEREAPAPRVRKRRTPRVEDDPAAPAGEKTPAAE
jgi:hypothetical protein